MALISCFYYCRWCRGNRYRQTFRSHHDCQMLIARLTSSTQFLDIFSLTVWHLIGRGVLAVRKRQFWTFWISWQVRLLTCDESGWNLWHFPLSMWVGIWMFRLLRITPERCIGWLVDFFLSSHESFSFWQSVKMTFDTAIVDIVIATGIECFWNLNAAPQDD